MNPNSKNIIRVAEMATPDQIHEGMVWYTQAHSFANEISHGDPDRAAGVISALSPMMYWEKNMELARLAFENGQAHGTFFTNVNKANAILNGKDWREVLTANKTRNFATLISNPNNFESVCIDRHAFDIAVGKKTDDKTRKTLDRVGVYDKFVQAYKLAAKSLDILPWQVQAITWVAWRAA